MWPNFFTGFPFPFPTLGRVNLNTLPTVAVTVGTENVTWELPDHAFRNRDYVEDSISISVRRYPPERPQRFPFSSGRTGTRDLCWLTTTSRSRSGISPVRGSMKSITTSTPTKCTLSTVGTGLLRRLRRPTSLPKANN